MPADDADQHESSIELKGSKASPKADDGALDHQPHAVLSRVNRTQLDPSWREGNWRLVNNPRPEWPRFSLRVHDTEVKPWNSDSLVTKLSKICGVLWGTNLSNDNTWSRLHQVWYLIALLFTVMLGVGSNVSCLSMRP